MPGSLSFFLLIFLSLWIFAFCEPTFHLLENVLNNAKISSRTIPILGKFPARLRMLEPVRKAVFPNVPIEQVYMNGMYGSSGAGINTDILMVALPDSELCQVFDQLPQYALVLIPGLPQCVCKRESMAYFFSSGQWGKEGIEFGGRNNLCRQLTQVGQSNQGRPPQSMTPRMVLLIPSSTPAMEHLKFLTNPSKFISLPAGNFLVIRDGLWVFVHGDDVFFRQYKPSFAQVLGRNFWFPLVPFWRYGGDLVEIGAHTGWQYLDIWAFISPNSQVHAYEPAPKHFEALEFHKFYHKMNRLHVYNKAIYKESGKMVPFEVYNNFSSSIQYDSSSTHQNTVLVETITIDDLVEKDLKGRPIATVRMDIEGGEYDAILGAKNFFSQNEFPYIMTEFHLKRYDLLKESIEKFKKMMDSEIFVAKQQNCQVKVSKEDFNKKEDSYYRNDYFLGPKSLEDVFDESICKDYMESKPSMNMGDYRPIPRNPLNIYSLPNGFISIEERVLSGMLADKEWTYIFGGNIAFFNMRDHQVITSVLSVRTDNPIQSVLFYFEDFYRAEMARFTIWINNLKGKIPNVEYTTDLSRFSSWFEATDVKVLTLVAETDASSSNLLSWCEFLRPHEGRIRMDIFPYTACPTDHIEL